MSNPTVPPGQTDLQPEPQPDLLQQAAGLLLAGDAAHQPLLQALQQATPAKADRLMRRALAALVQWQQNVDAQALPPLDEAAMAHDLALFPSWCAERAFGIAWTTAEHAQWQRICRLLIDSALAQPVVAVHMGWTPRNLRISGGEGEREGDGDGNSAAIGILDCQGAVAGPITHDLASLLRDASVSWDEAQEIDWAVRWWEAARRAGLPVDRDFGELWRALEWTGLQQHLGAIGAFCRSQHSGGQAQDAADLPRLFAYANRVALRYGPLKPLLKLLEPMSGNKVGAGFTF